MTIRQATAAELGRILEIYADARTFMREHGNPDQWGEGYPPESLIREDVATGRSYVCEEEGAILGVFYFAEETDPTYEQIVDGAWQSDTPYGVVHRIAVSAHGRGVAAACFAYAYGRCKNVRIDTHENNLAMQRALAKNGFVRCGTIFLPDGSPRIAYQRCER